MGEFVVRISIGRDLWPAVDVLSLINENLQGVLTASNEGVTLEVSTPTDFAFFYAMPEEFNSFFCFEPFAVGVSIEDVADSLDTEDFVTIESHFADQQIHFILESNEGFPGQSREIIETVEVPANHHNEDLAREVLFGSYAVLRVSSPRFREILQTMHAVNSETVVITATQELAIFRGRDNLSIQLEDDDFDLEYYPGTEGVVVSLQINLSAFTVLRAASRMNAYTWFQLSYTGHTFMHVRLIPYGFLVHVFL